MGEDKHAEKGAKDGDKEKDAKKEYEALASRLSLPSYVELDREFVLGSLEPGNFVLRSVLFKMQDRCDLALKILNDIIQPENHISDMRESEALSDADRKGVLDLVRKLSLKSKEFLIAEFDYSEDQCVGLIKGFFSEWKELKPEFIRILIILRDTWKKDVESKPDYQYFG
ncbi:hypothetical protein JW711_01225 [Candidatus Woesearchaeota archaeon]|nr:hypothetical protein [Candidatus Woesearchaeota archaeon]